MRKAAILLAALATFAADPARAACPVDDQRVETVIATTPAFQDGANAQVVRDLRTLRDAAAVLDAYDHEGACKRVVAVLKTLTANPERALEAGDTDESKGEEVARARTPKAAKP